MKVIMQEYCNSCTPAVYIDDALDSAVMMFLINHLWPRCQSIAQTSIAAKAKSPEEATSQ